MTSAQRGWLVIAVVAVTGAALDQGTKLWAHYDLRERPGRQVMISECCADLTYARNPGAAFSFLADRGPVFRKLFFVTVSLAAVVLMLYLYRRGGERRPIFEWALGFLIGGALGNLVDRIRFNEVIDFIHVHWKDDFHWPTFNVADIAIVAGIGLVLIDAYVHRPSRRAKPAKKGGRK